MKQKLLFVAMGVAAMAAQIIIMRRLIVVFGGNELVSGAVFAAWLFWSGIGNVTAGKIADRITDAHSAASFSLFLMALAIPATVAASGLVKAAMGVPPPAMLGLPLIALSTIALMAPLGFLIGFAFTVACRLPLEGGAFGIGQVYSLDAIGCGIGGMVFSLAAIRYFSPLEASLIAAGLLAAAVGFTFKKPLIKFSALLIVAALAAAVSSSQKIESAITSIEWKGFNAISEIESLFASLMVTDNRGERTLFVDGRPSFTLPLPETYEAVANIPLIEHKNPRDVAIIGGGISGVMGQWKQWGLNREYFLRIDPDETRLEKNEMPSDLNDIPPWAQIIHADGRRAIKHGLPGGCVENCLDAIIINVGDPDTASADRYFTVEFFAEAAKMLRKEGIISLNLLDTTNVVGPEAEKILGTVFASLEKVFPNIAVVPLGRYYFIASKETGILTDDPASLGERVLKRGIIADYLRSVELAGIYSERVAAYRKKIEEAAGSAEPNSDLKPSAYRAGMMLWEAKAGSYNELWLKILSRVRMWMGIAAIAILAAVSVFFGRRFHRHIKAAWTLGAIGFSSIAYEIVLIIHYQMSEGILVWRIGLILTAFMTGAGAGAIAAYKIFRKKQASEKLIVICLVIFAAYMPLLFFTAKASFLLANFLMGAISGWIYQLTALSLVSSGIKTGKAAGIIESSDHWGAAIGALSASIIFVPLYGLYASLAMASFVLVAAAMVVSLRNRLV